MICCVVFVVVVVFVGYVVGCGAFSVFVVLVDTGYAVLLGCG